MPTISAFYGIVIAMYWGDHAPAHFHAMYGEREAVVDIATLAVVRGGLPLRAQALVMEWAEAHRDELLANWDLCSRNQRPSRIEPLT